MAPMTANAGQVNFETYNDFGNNYYSQAGVKCSYVHCINLNVLLSLGLVFGKSFDRLVVSDAVYNRLGPRTRCLEGTRENVFKHVERWLDPIDQGNQGGRRPVCWFSGPAGCIQLCGKQVGLFV
jgi:hypothetical protein